MELNCLIKLLAEKEIIKREHACTIDNKTIMMSYSFEYQEVFEKIIESDYNKDIIKIVKSQYSSKEFCILNVENLEEGLIALGKGEERFTLRMSSQKLKPFPYYKLKKIINTQTRFSTDTKDLNHDYFQLIDKHLEYERIRKEQQKKDEVLDFLNQLP